MGAKDAKKVEGSGALIANVNDAIAICKDLDLLERQNSCPPYPEYIISIVRGHDYLTEWKTYIELSQYDILFTDGSLIQFKIRPQFSNEISFCYYECPYDILSYSDFVKVNYGKDTGSGGDYIFWQEYEQYRDESELKPHVCPLRYDYSPSLYDAGVHPASHMHIGRNTQIRIATDRIMNPISFFLFVIRQYYPTIWKEKFHPHAKASTWVRQIRDALVAIEKTYSNAKDKWEIVLT